MSSPSGFWVRMFPNYEISTPPPAPPRFGEGGHIEEKDASGAERLLAFFSSKSIFCTINKLSQDIISVTMEKS
jgi:hypothetical protein